MQSKAVDVVDGIEQAFPGEGVTLATITKALAVFERSIASGPAPFDAWLDGRQNAISDSAKHGFVLFIGKAACAGCHSGWRFTDGRLHDIGLPDADAGKPATPGAAEGEYGFKTPTLRNVSRRAPFMHDGSMPSLEAVMTHYRNGGAHKASQSKLIRPLELTDAESADVVAFLQSLSEPARSFPAPTLPQ